LRILLVFILSVSLAGCAQRERLVFYPAAAEVNRVIPVFVGTTRDVVPNIGFGNQRDYAPHFARYDIALPPNRAPGQIVLTKREVDPKTQFLATAKVDYPTGDGFRADLAKALRKRGGVREAVIYVHGFNNTFAEGMLRITQLAQDFDIPGVPVHYSWASAGNPLNYAYDRDSVLFARDGLEALISEVRAAGAQRIVLLGHSVGSELIMETLRQIAIARPGSVARDIAGVILISPDIDVDVFRSQVTRIGTLPKPFGIFISRRDRALTLSARLTGQHNRLGNVENLDQVSDLSITVVDVTDYSEGAGHFTVADTPELIKLFSSSNALNAAFNGDRAGRSGLGAGTVLTVQNLTAIVLSPVTEILKCANSAAPPCRLAQNSDDRSAPPPPPLGGTGRSPDQPPPPPGPGL